MGADDAGDEHGVVGVDCTAEAEGRFYPLFEVSIKECGWRHMEEK